MAYDLIQISPQESNTNIYVDAILIDIELVVAALILLELGSKDAHYLRNYAVTEP
jgi:hypothetical protein